MKIGIFFFAATVLSSTLVIGLPINQPKYSTRQAQEEYLREHGYYGNCTHDNAVYRRASDSRAVEDSPGAEEGRLSFEGDYIVRVEDTESGESDQEELPVDPMELLFWKAVRCFQRKFDLPLTGVVNEETRKEMEAQSDAPSSDVHNRRKRFVITGKWKKTNLTYYIINYDVDRSKVNLTKEVIRSEIQRAIKFWTDASGLTVTEKNATDADILIGFYTKDHRDGFPFDGSSGTLAHTFMPEDGDIHLDGDENWSAYTNKGLDLLYVTMHEFGHAIGIWHSKDKDSVMAPEVRGFDPNRELAEDDILAVQSIYGLPPGQTNTTSPAPKP